MNPFKKIIEISKNLASAILNEEKADVSDLQNRFNKKDATEIIEKLTGTKEKKDREVLIKAINKSKPSDWNHIKTKIYFNKKTTFLSVFSKVAAILIVSLSLGYLYISYDNNVFSKKESIVSLPTDENNIILELDNGNKEIISSDGTRSILNKEGNIVGNQEGTKLNYSNTSKEKTVEALVYNQLTIPYGKIFQLVLSDGTNVHLNSGSTLRYPVNFIEGKKRIVYLKGEAFFKVSKDKKHPFVVKTDDMNIRVLGTAFNVSSYPEDYFIKTVLVEGAVDIYSPKNKYKKAKTTSLTPGHRANWKKSNSDVKVKKVDTSIFTAWIDGKIVFEHMNFNNIIKKLERHYNITITNNNTLLAKEKFTARFDTETIEQVLNAFNKNYAFEYTIENNHITIN